MAELGRGWGVVTFLCHYPPLCHAIPSSLTLAWVTFCFLFGQRLADSQIPTWAQHRSVWPYTSSSSRAWFQSMWRHGPSTALCSRTLSRWDPDSLAPESLHPRKTHLEDNVEGRRVSGGLWIWPSPLWLTVRGGVGSTVYVEEVYRAWPPCLLPGPGCKPENLLHPLVVWASDFPAQLAEIWTQELLAPLLLVSLSWPSLCWSNEAFQLGWLGGNSQGTPRAAVWEGQENPPLQREQVSTGMAA